MVLVFAACINNATNLYTAHFLLNKSEGVGYMGYTHPSFFAACINNATNFVIKIVFGGIESYG